MKIINILKQYDSGVAFEFFPPKSIRAKKSFTSAISALKMHKPLYVSVTHGARGSSQEQTQETVMLLKEKELLVMPHLICMRMNKQSIRVLLNAYEQQGIENIMALRGDLPKRDGDNTFQGDFRYARDLVTFIKKNSHFCVGVAVYPEGHIESSSLDDDLEWTKQKIDVGADFAVTQMFFDNAYYFALLERMRKKGIIIPVIPGILPLADISQVKEFASFCKATIPKKIEKSMIRYGSNPSQMQKVGLDFTIQQCRNLVKNGIKRLHFFTLNKPDVMKTVLSNL